MAHQLNDADERILALLTEGRNLPQNLAERLDYSRQYVQNRLQMLKAADYVQNLGGGLYEITDEGREKIGAEPDEDDVDLDALRTEIEAIVHALEDVDGDRAHDHVVAALEILEGDDV